MTASDAPVSYETPADFELLRLRLRRLEHAFGLALSSYGQLGSDPAPSHQHFRRDIKATLDACHDTLHKKESQYRALITNPQALPQPAKILSALKRLVDELTAELNRLSGALQPALAGEEAEVLTDLQQAFQDAMQAHALTIADKQEILARHLLKVQLDEIRTLLANRTSPTVFISYSWDNLSLSQRVHRLAKDLKRAGFGVTLDSWHNRSGSVTAFIERIGQVDVVLLIGTPGLVAKWTRYSASAQAQQSASCQAPVYSLNVVALELERIGQRILQGSNNQYRVLNVLLAGQHATSFPSLTVHNASSFYDLSTPGSTAYYSSLFNLLADCLPNPAALRAAKESLQQDYISLYQHTSAQAIDALYQDYLGQKNKPSSATLTQRIKQTSTASASLSQAHHAMLASDTSSTLPSQIAPVSWQLPTWNPKFIERHDPLQQLARVFKTQDTSVITQPYSITGLGGIGKTQLAVAYAHQAKKQNLYGAIVWLNADETLTHQYQALAKQLALEASYPDTCALLTAINERLVELQALVIFDNAKDYESVKAYLPAAGVKVIITSRNQDWGTCDTLALSTFSLPEVTAYVRTFLPHAHHDDIKTLADSLGYLPLAISQALAYMVKSKIAIAAYLSRYKQQHLAFLDKPLFADDLHQMTVARTLGLSLQALQDENAQSGHAAVEVLYYTSYLLPDAIPRFLIERLLGDENQTDEALMLLQRYSLLSVEEKAIGVHRLVQVVLSAQIQRLADKKSELEERLITTLTELLPRDDVDYYQRSQQWPLMNQVLAHARWLVDEKLLPTALLAYGVGLFEFYHSRNGATAKLYLQQAHQQALNLPAQAQALTVLLLAILELSSNEPEKIIQKLQQLIAGQLRTYPTLLALGWECLSHFLDVFSEQDLATKASEEAFSLYQTLEHQASGGYLPHEAGVYAFRQAQLYAKLENYTAALRAIDSALQHHDSNPFYWRYKGDMANDLPTGYVDPLACYEKAIALQPDSVDHYFKRGNTYFRLNQPEQALKDYTQVITLDPTYASAYNNRGITYDDLKQPEKALEDYTQAIALNPTDASAYFTRGITYQNLNQPEQALADYTKAIALNPIHAEAYFNRGITYQNLNQPEQALEDYTQAIALDPIDARAYFNRGTTYQNLNQPEQALEDYTQAIALDRTNASAYNNRGVTYSDLNQPEQALEDYTQAIALDPTNASAYVNRGTTYGSLNQPEQALEDYTQAIALDHTHAMAYNNRGATYQNLNQPEQALKDYTKAIALDPTDAEAYFNQGTTYDDLNQPEQALEDYTQAIALDPTHAKAYNNRGNIYGSLNQPEQALEDYTKAIALDPIDAETYFNRGDTYKDLNQYEQALNDITQAVTRSPEAIDYRVTRGVLYLLTGQYALALEDFKLVIEHEPQEANHYLNQAAAHAGLAEYEKALQTIEQAIQLAPDDLYALFSRAWVYTLQDNTTQALRLYEDLLTQTPSEAMSRIQAYAKLGKALVDGLIQCEPWPFAVIDEVWLQAKGSDRAEICRFLIEFLAVHATALPTQAMMAIEQTQALLKKTSSELPVLKQRLNALAGRLQEAAPLSVTQASPSLFGGKVASHKRKLNQVYEEQAAEENSAKRVKSDTDSLSDAAPPDHQSSARNCYLM